MVMVVLALKARGDPTQLIAQKMLQRLAYAARSAGSYLDTVFLEKVHSALAHTVGQHHVSPLAVDKSRDLTRLVVAVVRVVYGGNCFDVVSSHLPQSAVHQASSQVRSNPNSLKPLSRL